MGGASAPAPPTLSYPTTARSASPTSRHGSSRTREAMRQDGLAPIGGSGKVVEADETYLGHKEDKRLGKITKRGKRGLAGKRPIVALVERGGQVRTFHVDRATVVNVRDVVVRNVSRESTFYTDESNLYVELGREFDSHRSVRHSAGEYVRREGDAIVHTNTVENVFSYQRR